MRVWRAVGHPFRRLFRRRPQPPNPLATLNPATYWQRPDEPTPNAAWRDPDPATRGLLSADRIQYYVEIAHMVQPFSEAKLKPASYPLALGPDYQIEGKNKRLTELDPVLIIPPNSIVFVSMLEALQLPHYIAARFNLSIELVYQGLLLGTGPQVDPGFQGVLSCPLHNISNSPIAVRLGEHLATIDFIKTTGIAERAPDVLASVHSEEDLYNREDELVGHEGRHNRLFKDSKRWARPIVDYPSGKRRIGSSVAKLETDLRNYKVVTALAVAALLAVAATVFTVTLMMFLDLQGQVRNSNTQLQQLREGLLLSPLPTPAPTSTATRPHK